MALSFNHILTWIRLVRSVQNLRLFKPWLSLGFSLPSDSQTYLSNRTFFFCPTKRNLIIVSLHKAYKCGMTLVKLEAWDFLFLEVTWRDSLRTLGLLRAVLITTQLVWAPHSTDIEAEPQKGHDSYHTVKLMCRKTTSWTFNSDDEWILNGLIQFVD